MTEIKGLVTIDCIDKLRYVIIPETVIVLESERYVNENHAQLRKGS